jgi:XTP/dITP diphosphohydrolase
LRRLQGEVAGEERGEGGFSYDAIFRYPPLGMTFAEIPEAQKNEISHRALAARALARALRNTQAIPMNSEKKGHGGT